MKIKFKILQSILLAPYARHRLVVLGSFFILIFAFFIGVASAVGAELDIIPKQLFDINLTINDETVNSIDELSASAVFVSFGRIPTPVDVTFTILNQAGNQVHIERESIIVETELVLTKQFKGLGLKSGEYTIVLDTVYNTSIKDTFKRKFKILDDRMGINFWISKFWILIMIVVVGAVWVFYQILNPANEQPVKSGLNTIRAIEDEKAINGIMLINRFIVVVSSVVLIYLTWVFNIIRFDPLLALLVVAPAVVAINGVWLFYCRSRKPKKFYFLPQVLIDTGLILAVVYYTGGLYSDFLFLPLIILSLAALVSWRLSFIVFALSVSFYFILFFYQMWGLSAQEIFQSFGGLNGMKLIRILIFAFMGALTSFAIAHFINEIRRRNEEIEKIKQETYSKVVRGLCDPLTAIRFMLEEFNKKEFVARNPELAKNIEILRQFEKEAQEVVKKSLRAVDQDFLPR